MRAKLDKRVLGVVLALALLISAAPVLAESPSTEILLEPTPVEVAPGNAFAITLKIKNVPEPGMAAYDFRITFTPGVIEFAGEPTDHSQHEWPSPYGEPFVFHIDNSAGYIAFIDVFTDTTAPSGNITLAVLNGTTTESATTSLHFEKADIRYPDSSAIPATVTDGEVVISLPNSSPILSGGAVSPSSGYTSASFTYSVTYTDADNDTPGLITVSIDDGASQNMAVKAGEDGDFTNREIYEYKTTGANLGLGTHTFQFAASDGLDNATGDIGLLSGPTVSSPPSPPPAGGGGGGGGGGGRPAGVTSVIDFITQTGKFTQDATASSEDRKVELNIPKGTIGKRKGGGLLTSVYIKEMEDPPTASVQPKVIGLVYDIGPNGVTFDPTISLTFKYDESLISQEVVEKNLVIATWDKTSEEWIEFESTVDPETNIISAKISHFTPFTIIVSLSLPPSPEPPPPPPTPAAFTFSSLGISPSKVAPGEEVNISVLVANTGGESGSYSVVLKINGVKEQEKLVMITTGRSRSVSFTVSKEDAGSYSVFVCGLSDSFRVVAPVVAPVVPPIVPEEVGEVPAPERNWPLTIGIIAALLVVIGLVATFFLVRRRA